MGDILYFLITPEYLYMEKSFAKELLDLLAKNFNLYKEWLKPTPGDPMALTVIKSFFKGLSSLLLIMFSPIVVVILIIAFLAAF